jgi:hypothetical protein
MWKLSLQDATDIKILKIPWKKVQGRKVGFGVPRLLESAHPNRSDPMIKILRTYAAEFQEIRSRAKSRRLKFMIMHALWVLVVNKRSKLR